MGEVDVFLLIRKSAISSLVWQLQTHKCNVGMPQERAEEFGSLDAESTHGLRKFGARFHPRAIASIDGTMRSVYGFRVG